jgi:ABC-type transport system involved in multi-copper enzyme maturation permease subunit
MPPAPRSGLGTMSLVAGHVFKESVRDKVLYNLVAFAVLLIATSYLIAQLTAGQDIKIIKDLGLAAISIFGAFIAVFIGVGLVWKEIEKRSIYALLAKPVQRHQFIAGKYAGLMLTLLINVAIMTVSYYAVLYFLGRTLPETASRAWTAPPTDPMLLKAILLIYVQLGVVTAIALFFSTFSSPFLSAALTLVLYVAGHFSADLKNFGEVIESQAAGAVATALYYVLPNFAAFDVKAAAVHGLPITWTYVGLAAAYGLLYALALVGGALLIFTRRDFR